MLACQIEILVAFKDQLTIDQLIKENHAFPYAERYKTCSGLLGPVSSWAEDQKKDKDYLRVEVRYVHVSERDDYRSVVIKTSTIS